MQPMYPAGSHSSRVRGGTLRLSQTVKESNSQSANSRVGVLLRILFFVVTRRCTVNGSSGLRSHSCAVTTRASSFNLSSFGGSN